MGLVSGRLAYGKQDQAEKMLLKVPQETLAEMVGRRRSRVNVFMNKFRKLGFRRLFRAKAFFGKKK